MSVPPFRPACPFVPLLDVPCQSAVPWRNDTLSWGPRARSRQLPCQAEPWEMWGTHAFSFRSSFSVKSLLEKNVPECLGFGQGPGPEQGREEKGSLVGICCHLGMLLLPSSCFIYPSSGSPTESAYRCNHHRCPCAAGFLPRQPRTVPGLSLDLLAAHGLCNQ